MGNDAVTDVDVLVVGAGIGGLYAIHRFTAQGLTVRCIEAADGVGGVWWHNRYPGARVDVDSLDYCYHFSDELLEKWNWSERFASQPELQAYLEFVADMFDLKKSITFGTRVTAMHWSPQEARYLITTDRPEATCRARYVVMTTGQLSVPRPLSFPGLEDFRGQWVQTSRWPLEEVPLEGRRVGIIGTGSSGTQAIPVIAEKAEHLYVFQRTPHFVVPAQNRPLTVEEQRPGMTAAQIQRLLLGEPGGARFREPAAPLAEHSAESRLALLQAQWELGGQGMRGVFKDQPRSVEVSEAVSVYVRERIADVISDPELLEALTPRFYPLGARRLALGINYYETYLRDNVTLVDLRTQPLERITARGLRTSEAEYELDLLVFATGFVPFRASLDAIDIRNEKGAHPTDAWGRGPFTLVGLMIPGFPNFFTPTGPGSPSVSANLFVQNEFAIDWIADLIAYTDSHGYGAVGARAEAAETWSREAAEISQSLVEVQINNYKVHVNDDGTRVYIPYGGGLPSYVAACERIAAEGYRELEFG